MNSSLANNIQVPHTVLSYIKDSTRSNPDKEAVRIGDRCMTYAELERSTNEWAAQIQRHRSGQSRNICIFAERSLEMVVVILAILKAGCAYVPIDRQCPKERISYILDDTCASLIVATPSSCETLSDLEVPLLSLDLGSSSKHDAPSADDSMLIDSSSIAYVMYTSGSTGKPKGVPVSHANLRYSISARFEYFHEPPGSFLLLSSYSFDSSVVGIFWTLSSGGTLVLTEDGSERDQRAIIETIAEHKITHMLCLPSWYSRLLDETGRDVLESLRTVIVAGEACPASLSRTHKERTNARLYNEYGPTEATVWSSVYYASGEEEGLTLPLGAAIPGTTLYLLDEDLNPVAPGDTGEICICGPGVTGGYLNQPSATEQKFGEVSFSESEDKRVYRSGDLGRWGESEVLEFLGRLDDQVKVRGYRIEPVEIEGCLLTRPEVREAAVMVNGEALIALVVLSSAADRDITVLRQHLKSVLPEYMVPSSLVVVEDLPHLPNGKLDRKALTSERISANPDYFQNPLDEIEFNLRGIFEGILHVRPVGVTDNFFELGGHSLLVVELVTQIELLFGAFIPIPQIFESPTVAELADHIRTADGARTNKSVVGLKTSGSRPPLFCVPGVGGHVLRHTSLPRYLDERQPYYVFQAPGFDGEGCLDSIESLAAHYLDAMREIQPVGPYLLAGECFGGIVVFEMAQILHREGEQVLLLALIESPVPDGGLTRLERFTERVCIKYPWLTGWIGQKGHSVDNMDTTGDEDLHRREPAAGRKRIIEGREEVMSGAHIIRNGKLQSSTTAPHVDVQHANRRAGSSYKPGVYPGMISLFITPKRTVTVVDRRRLWRRFTRIEPEQYGIAGTANSMLRESNVKVLADRLNECLQAVESKMIEGDPDCFSNG